MDIIKAEDYYEKHHKTSQNITKKALLTITALVGLAAPVMAMDENQLANLFAGVSVNNDAQALRLEEIKAEFAANMNRIMTSFMENIVSREYLESELRKSAAIAAIIRDELHIPLPDNYDPVDIMIISGSNPLVAANQNIQALSERRINQMNQIVQSLLTVATSTKEQLERELSISPTVVNDLCKNIVLDGLMGNALEVTLNEGGGPSAPGGRGGASKSSNSKSS